MADLPKISVIVAVLNGGETIERCISSVLHQTWPRMELIVQDGGSTDETLNILRSHDQRIAHWKSEKDRGICHAWNKALKAATGDWVCFLGSDDFFWRKNSVEKMIPHLKRALPEIRVVYARAAGVVDGEPVLFRKGKWDRNRFFNTLYFSHQAVMHHMSLFGQFGTFDTSFQIAGDYDFLLRCLKHEDAAYAEDVLLSGYTVGGLSNRVETAARTPLEAFRARRKNRIHGFSPQLTLYLAQCLIWKFSGKLFGKKTADRLADLYRIATFQKPIYADKSGKIFQIPRTNRRN